MHEQQFFFNASEYCCYRQTKLVNRSLSNRASYLIYRKQALCLEGCVFVTGGITHLKKKILAFLNNRAGASLGIAGKLLG